jgi:putative FmdB family regulatory protein
MYMPIYEYKCSNCEAVSEIFTNIGGHSDPLACKSCGSANLEKLLSAASIGTADGGQSSCSPKEKCYTPSCGTAPGSG